MTSLFCPQAVEWGDVATWFAAVATFLAVCVALGAAFWAEYKECARRKIEVVSIAHALGAEFDLTGQTLQNAVKTFDESFKGFGHAQDLTHSAPTPPDYASIMVLQSALVRLRFNALDRFVTRFGQFDQAAAKKLSLLYVQAALYVQSQNPDVEETRKMPRDLLEQQVEIMKDFAGVMCNLLYDAKLMMGEIAQISPSEWHTTRTRQQ